jgi:hypothetical protein
LCACGGGQLDPGATGGSGNPSSDGGASSGTGASPPVARGGGGAGGSLILDVNGGASDDQATEQCEHLNIGIFGNPGANASSNFQDWLVKSGTSAQRLQTTQDEPLTSAVLAPFDVVILDWLARDYTPEEAEIFAAWISAGGGAAAMTGYSNVLVADWHANSLLAPLRVAYSGPLVSGPIVDFAAHPITVGLSSVTFLGGYLVADLGGTASTRTPIAFLPSQPNDAAGIAIEMGEGRAIVWGDEWIEFDSEWSTLPQITQFWVQLFAWIAPTTKCALTPQPK